MATQFPVLELFDHYPRALLAFRTQKALEKREQEMWLRNMDGKPVKYIWIETEHDHRKLAGYQFSDVHFHGKFDDIVIHMALSRVR